MIVYIDIYLLFFITKLNAKSYSDLEKNIYEFKSP